MDEQNARLTEVEIKLTHQERMVETLNGVIIELRRELERLHQRIDMVERMGVRPEDEPANDPPPHY